MFSFVICGASQKNGIGVLRGMVLSHVIMFASDAIWSGGWSVNKPVNESRYATLRLPHAGFHMAQRRSGVRLNLAGVRLNLALKRQKRHRKALTRLRPQRLKWRLLSECKMS
jgi:hypothetical protein